MDRTAEISQTVKQLLAASTPSQVGTIYEQMVGYDVHADDPAATLESLRGLALGYVREVCNAEGVDVRTVGLPGFLVEFSWAEWTPEIAQLLTRGWTDTSWHNDTCPSFVNPERTLRLWVEAADPGMRDNLGLYCLVTEFEEDPSQSVLVLETDNWGEVCQRLQFEIDDDTVVEEATQAALDAACRVIQDHLGVTTGDFAGLFFSGDAADPIRAVLRRYLKDQRADEQAVRDSGFADL